MITGTDAVIRELLKFGKEAEDSIKDITEMVGRDMELDATQGAANAVARLDDRTKNQASDLAQGISMKVTDNGFSSEVFQNVLPMGAYVEFGTGNYVVVDPEWKDLAWQFYVNGKGRLHAAPYMWPAFERGRKLYLAELTTELDILTKRFNEPR